MPKRRRTASQATKNLITESIKIKIEKDYEEEESIVIQNFQLAASFDEANKIKKETEINYELVVEDKEGSSEDEQRELEDGPTSDDEIESSSGNEEDFSERSAASFKKYESKPKIVPNSRKSDENCEEPSTELQIKQEPEEYQASVDYENVHKSQQISSQSQLNTLPDEQFEDKLKQKEKISRIKKEFEDSGVDFVQIEVKITKVDMEMAESYAKRLRIDQY